MHSLLSWWVFQSEDIVASSQKYEKFILSTLPKTSIHGRTKLTFYLRKRKKTLHFRLLPLLLLLDLVFKWVLQTDWEGPTCIFPTHHLSCSSHLPGRYSLFSVALAWVLPLSSLPPSSGFPPTRTLWSLAAPSSTSFFVTIFWSSSSSSSFLDPLTLGLDQCGTPYWASYSNQEIRWLKRYF